MQHKPNQSSLSPKIQIADAFHALRILSDGRLINGLDEWRHHTGDDSLNTIDHDLSQLVKKQPPTKFGHTDTPSLWTSTHFHVALPSLSYALRMYGGEDEAVSKHVLSATELTQYFVAFPHIVQHYREFRFLDAKYGPMDDIWWSMHLEVPLEEVTPRTPLLEILQSLPDYLRDRTAMVIADQGDSLVGRIVLAFLLTKNISPVITKLDKRALNFLEPIGEHQAKNLYERLKHAQRELAVLDEYLADYDETQGLVLGKLLQIVRWYGRPELVEMVIPGLVGAAVPAIRALLALFKHIHDEGGPDYTDVPIDMLPSIQKFRSTQSLLQIGRLSLIKDILDGVARSGGGVHDAPESDGVVLRKVAASIYDEHERFQEWGNATYYVPDDRSSLRSFPTYRQDVANIVFCAGLVAEHEAVRNTSLVVELKKLAFEIKETKTAKGLRSLVRSHDKCLKQLAVDWEARYPGHERVRIIHFLRQSFGFDIVRPVPIMLEEINKSFGGSYYDGRSYHLHYQEASENISLKIMLNSGHAGEGRPVKYQVIEGQTTHLPLTADGLPYAAWLELESRTAAHPIIIPVPGRGTIDPFGRVGDLHAGEIVGFGCSVHHAALALALAELAALGAGKTELQKVKRAFMRINKGVHERYDLADYQLAMTLAAFNENHMLTISEYLADQPESIFDADRVHLKSYRRPGKKSIAWAQSQAARLAFGYPELYPYHTGDSLDPRCCWYDGSPVSAHEGDMAWYMLSAPKLSPARTQSTNR